MLYLWWHWEEYGKPKVSPRTTGDISFFCIVYICLILAITRSNDWSILKQHIGSLSMVLKLFNPVFFEFFSTGLI